VGSGLVWMGMEKRKSLAPPGFGPRTFQPIMSCFLCSRKLKIRKSVPSSGMVLVKRLFLRYSLKGRDTEN
jgi:hypothetical protein